jgi:hypothetical protein
MASLARAAAQARSPVAMVALVHSMTVAVALGRSSMGAVPLIVHSAHLPPFQDSCAASVLGA